jgi:hypothetical protein
LTIPSSELRDKSELEKKYSMFAWKWAVSAHVAARVVDHGRQLPGHALHHLISARRKMESGHHTLCDVAADLRILEIELFPLLLRVGEAEVNKVLELIRKAMNGTIPESDIDFSRLKPFLPDCTIPKPCVR